MSKAKPQPAPSGPAAPGSPGDENADHGRTPRLFCPVALAIDQPVALAKEQSHYLVNVMRLGEGARVLVFNGRDGEWLAGVHLASRKVAELVPLRQVRPQPGSGDLHYLFAPLKQARLDYMVQKAVEMGATTLQPVLTQHTQVSRINVERMQANAVEAAEQCGILALPAILPEVRFDRLMAGWDPTRRLVFCDEGARVADPVTALRAVPPGPLAVLIGPEGGFSAAERTQLLRLPGVVRLSLGPRILRADTAAVAALAVVQAVLGDWQG